MYLTFILSCPAAQQDKWITIFVHGGGAHPLYLNISDTFKIISDNISTSVYTKTTELLRKDPYFMQMQPQQRVGLTKSWPIKTMNPSNGAQIFGKFYSEMNNFAELPPTEMYSFGWAGLLSCKVRRRASEKLYEEIASLAKKIRKQGDNPKFRLIAYSHGGNVALHLGEVARNRKYTPFKIEQLILVSTPIHTNTQFYLQNGLFKNTYLFYSKGDNIQSSDFLSSPTNSFSHHTFLAQEGPIPKNITQVQVRIFRTKISVPRKKGPAHIIPRYEMVHPNHTEMFFFGWAPEWYRKYFPIRPLSVSLLIPYFLKAIEKNHLKGKHIRITVVPEEEEMIIKIRNAKRTEDLEIPFLTQQELNHFRKKLQQFRPANVAYKDYRKRMKKHWHAAKEFIRKAYKQKLKARHQKKKLKGKPVCNISLFQEIKKTR